MLHKYSPYHYTTTTTTITLIHWSKAGWSILSCCICQIQGMQSECRSRNWDVFPVFYCPIFVILSKLLPVSSSHLIEVAPGMVFCCCSLSASRFWYLDCKEWLSYCCLWAWNSMAILLFQEEIYTHRIAIHWDIFFFWTFSVNPIDCCAWKSL